MLLEEEDDAEDGEEASHWQPTYQAEVNNSHADGKEGEEEGQAGNATRGVHDQVGGAARGVDKGREK